ncbi:sugar ABC transporter ATP-binding protein [Pseudoxanthobacter sp.]|uniref:sugar ABC transporter ATP-binding protein n=1 Tax=Pseudoxanthobacter sp. TaxID=1925742 RepID=UPI002FDF8B53
MPSDTAHAAPLLVANGISKTFGRTRALSGATFALRAGEIHGLLGANGAGKSTLSKVISGHYTVDGGTLQFAGEPIRLSGTRDALRIGIAIVMQETSLVPDLSVLENIFLPELARPGRLNRAALRTRARAILDELGQGENLPLDIEVRHLSSAQKQLVEIAKALALSARLIIFDEPSASLSPGEVERLFDIMGRLRASGRGLIFVSHRLEEVFSLTDRVTVMREGRTVMAARETAGLSQSELIRAMVGAELGAIYEHHGGNGTEGGGAGRFGAVALEVRNLAAPPLVRDVSLQVREGEIVGLGGLVGAGRSEAVEAVFGLRRRAGGSVSLMGRPLPAMKPQAAIRAGMGFVAEDRRTQNIVPDLSVRENLLLAHLGAHRGFLCNYRARERRAEELLAELGLPADRLLDASMLNFSGGMQQKIIMARWLLLDPKVLILDEPTKGVDIGARASIYAMLRAIAARGVAVVVVSSDFEELIGLSDRIVVISDGRSVADLPAAMLDEEKLTLLAAPRTSMARNTALLGALTAEFGGAGFWALMEEDRLICLNAVVSDGGADPGFRAGEARRLGETRIPEALRRRDGAFVTDADEARPVRTLMMPITSHRGHDLGWVGLSLARDGDLPAPEAIRARVATMAATL